MNNKKGDIVLSVVSTPLYGIIAGIICFVLAIYCSYAIGVFSTMHINMDDAIDYGFGLAVSSIPIISDIIDAIHMIIMAITNFSKFFSSIIGVAVLALAVWLAYTLMKDYVDRIKWFEKGKPLRGLLITILFGAPLILVEQCIPYDTVLQWFYPYLASIEIKHSTITNSYYVLSGLYLIVLLSSISKAVDLPGDTASETTELGE